MVKVKFSGLLGDRGTLDFVYNDIHNISLQSKSTSEVVYVDSDGGDKIIFDGSDLKVNSHNVIVKGIVTGVNFTNADGASYVQVTGGHFDAKALYGTYVNAGDYGLQMMVAQALAGNDHIIGSDSGDVLSGHAGDDVIKTGLGDDLILFGRHEGHDIVKDFNPNEFLDDGVTANPDHDLIWAETKAISIKDSENDKNTVVDFGKGHTLVLIGVHADQIDLQTDFYHF
jgi:hypothetical protein